MRGGTDIRFWGADHNLDHLRLRTTWDLWTLWHEKARFSDEKARKSTQNEAKNRCFCVWDHQAAGLSPVAPTIWLWEAIPEAFFFDYSDADIEVWESPRSNGTRANLFDLFTEHFRLVIHTAL